MIIPVILCGGTGTRLWPLSRKNYPKQFTTLVGSESLFQTTVRRLSGPDFAPPVVATNAEFRFIVREQLEAIGIASGTILIEPAGRNTAPAVLAAAMHLAASDREALMLVAPSDHAMPDVAAFHAAIAAGIKPAREGAIITFGLRPTRPETGYGWLELAEDPGDYAPRPVQLTDFVEKPDAKRAEAMLQAGTHLWNAGIFMFSVNTVLSAFETHAQGLVEPVSRAVRDARTDLGFLWLAAEPWNEAENISIDYAIMERASNLWVIPYAAGSSDLGDWDAVWHETRHDGDNLASKGHVTAIDCHDSVLRSESEGLELVGIGLQDIVVVAMTDAVLVADRSRAQDVKKAVQLLKSKGIKQAETFPRDHRPWGWFESLIIGDRFQVKRIVVNPGSALSLQSHVHRSEHWIVVEGTAKVTVDKTTQLLAENQSVYVPLGAVHRLENPGKVPVVLIEVQTGSYLGEDDIVRYEDLYARQ